MESFDITLFEVGFSKIAATLANYGVDIRWEEKEREKAVAAWQQWSRLDDIQKSEIARTLLADIEPALRESLKVTLDTNTPREIRSIEVAITTNLGEAKHYTFESIEAAIEFLGNFDEQEILSEEQT